MKNVTFFLEQRPLDSVKLNSIMHNVKLISNMLGFHNPCLLPKVV